MKKFIIIVQKVEAGNTITVVALKDNVDKEVLKDIFEKEVMYIESKNDNETIDTILEKFKQYKK